MSKKAILLVRVSTTFQDTDPQKDSLIEYANSKGFTELHIIETKESGLADISDRSGLENLFAFCKNNPDYKTVFSTEMSRLGRRQSVLSTIKENFVREKIQLFVKNIDFKLLDDELKLDEKGNIMFTLFGLFAENEIATKKNRFIQKRIFDMKNGINIAGKNLFGYKKIYDNKRVTWTVDEYNAEIVRQVFSFYINGFANNKNPSIAKIVQECIRLNYPKYTHSKRNINKLLKESGYTGYKITNNKRKVIDTNGSITYKVTQNEIRYPTPIITNEIFNKAQAKLLSNNSKAEKASKHTTILSKMILCSVCGNHFMGEYRTKNGYSKNTYRCSSRTRVTPECTNKQSISMTLLDSVIWGYILQRKDLIKIIETINPDDAVQGLELNIAKYKSKIEELSKIVNDANGLLGKLTKSKRYNEAERVLESIQKYEGKLKKQRNELTKLEEKITELNDSNELLDRLKSTISINQVSKSLIKQYVNFLLEKIEIKFHDSKYTIIEIKNRSFVKYKKEMTYTISDSHPHILIDKSNTLKPQVIVIEQPIGIETDNIFLVDSSRPDTVKKESYISLSELFSNIKNGASQVLLFRNRLDEPSEKYNPYKNFKVMDYKKITAF